jgi:triosephosphate isomerase (TIM)
MRKKLFAANWKMNLNPAEGRALIGALRALIDPAAAELARDREVMVAPPFLTIPAVTQALAGSSIALGAQNVHFEAKGAFTGEISPSMLKFFGISYVIIGHSERRHVFHETDELISKRVAGALVNRLTPILCVGETLEQRDSGLTLETVLSQLQKGLAEIKPEAASQIVIAYEPVWAIGTGRTATPEQAQTVHGAIRELLGDSYGHDTAAKIRLIYGGSATPDNIDSLAAKPDIDGALVGGASLNADSFARIVRANIG